MPDIVVNVLVLGVAALSTAATMTAIATMQGIAAVSVVLQLQLWKQQQ